MVHTFEITYKTTPAKAQQILEDYLAEAEIKNFTKRKATKPLVNPSNVPGIAELRINLAGGYATITLKIEPQSLLEGRLTMRVFDCQPDNVNILVYKLQKEIAALLPTLPQQLGKWTLTRIDYTQNLSSKHVKELVILANGGKDPYYFKDKLNEKGSAYRQSKSVTLNFYDKDDHIAKNTSLIERHPYLIEEAQDVFRVEVQCREWYKLKHIRDKYNLPKKATITDYLAPAVASDVIRYYYGMIIGPDDYYSLREAKKRIQAHPGWKKRKKDNLINWLKLIAQEMSVSGARELFQEGALLTNTDIPVKGSDATFNNYMKACREIRINPVTIPWGWKISHLTNPMDYQ